MRIMLPDIYILNYVNMKHIYKTIVMSTCKIIFLSGYDLNFRNISGAFPQEPYSKNIHHLLERES